MSAASAMIARSMPAQESDSAASASAADGISRLTAEMTKGSDDAFRQFHTLYFDRLFRYHLVLARGDENAAAESLQETFTRVVRHARRFETEEAFWSWLTVLARSAARDGGRKRQRYWRLLSDYARSLFVFDALPAAADEELWAELVPRSLERLAPEDRALVEGKYFSRLSVRELASQSGLTEKAVESRLLRARRFLRENLLERLNNET